MRINANDIMDEVDAHIRKFGGDYSEWVGTAKDSEEKGCQGGERVSGTLSFSGEAR